jgi:hypothetical protein
VAGDLAHGRCSVVGGGGGLRAAAPRHTGSIGSAPGLQ